MSGTLAEDAGGPVGYSFAIGTPLDELSRAERDAQVALLAGHGFDRVEWTTRDASRLSAANLRRALAETGVHLSALGTGAAALRDGLALTAADGGRRKEACRRVEATLEVAAEFGALTIVGLLRGPEAEQAGAARDRLVSCLQGLAELAQRRGTRLVLEPINRYEIDSLPTLAGTAELVAEVGHPGLTLMADFFHMNIEEGDMAAALRQWAGEIAYVHVADSDRRAPGSGHLPVKGLLRTLAVAGYRGPLVCELIGSGDLDADVRAAASGLRLAFQ